MIFYDFFNGGEILVSIKSSDNFNPIIFELQNSNYCPKCRATALEVVKETDSSVFFKCPFCDYSIEVLKGVNSHV